MSDPTTPDEWFSLAEQHRVSAVMLAADKVAAGQAVFHVGIAVECALKAYIMRTQRLNTWPSRAARPELYTHDLRALRVQAGITIDPRDSTAPSWHLLLQWDRSQGYDPKPMPRKVARSWIEAGFGPNGLVTCIRQNCP